MVSGPNICFCNTKVRKKGKVLKTRAIFYNSVYSLRKLTWLIIFLIARGSKRTHAWPYTHAVIWAVVTERKPWISSLLTCSVLCETDRMQYYISFARNSYNFVFYLASTTKIHSPKDVNFFKKGRGTTLSLSHWVAGSEVRSHVGIKYFTILFRLSFDSCSNLYIITYLLTPQSSRGSEIFSNLDKELYWTHTIKMSQILWSFKWRNNRGLTPIKGKIFFSPSQLCLYSLCTKDFFSGIKLTQREAPCLVPS